MAEHIGSFSFIHLPEEVLLIILSHLPIPDLLQCSRTCHLLRVLSADTRLHHERFLQAATDLYYSLLNRKSRASISPPNAWIRLTKTNVLSRSISKSLVKIRLNHRLESRPTIRDLILRAVLPDFSVITTISPTLIQPQRAVYKSQLKRELGKKLQGRPSMSSLVSLNIMPEECTRQISPVIIETRRQVIKATLKDGLKAWVESRGLKAQQMRAIELDEAERSTVKMLVRKLTARRLAAELEGRADLVAMEKKAAQARWGKACEVQRTRERNGSNGFRYPTRARVLTLKRFWEGTVSSAI